MISDKRRIEELMLKVLEQEASTEELEFFSVWLNVPENAACFRQFKKLWNLTSGPRVTSGKAKTELRRFIRFMHENKKQGNRFIIPRVYKIAGWVAACMLPFLVAWWGWDHWSRLEIPVQTVMADITPGSPKAVLVRASGERIVLQSGEIEKCFLGNNVRLDEKGQSLHYTKNDTLEPVFTYDQLDVPRGGEFTVNLADGTVVYLNSATTLKYPPVFQEKERKVFLSGEAWFEVKKEDERPFYVVTDAVTIRVYGTAFNISTRSNGNTRTVLVEGSIGIWGNQENAPEYRLKPAQMADYCPDGVLKQITDVDPGPYISWKDGLFVFENESLENIMDMLSLWYDVDVFYKGEQVKGYHFTGHMQRYEQIDIILNAISKMIGVHFSVTGRTIVVSK